MVLFALFGTLPGVANIPRSLDSAWLGPSTVVGTALVTDPQNHATRFEYDALGRRTAGFLPDDSVERVEYEAVNEAAGASIQVPKKTVTDFNGRQTTVFHDRMDRLVTNRFPAITRWDEVTGLLTDYRAVTNTYEYTATGRRARVVQSAAVNRAECYVYDTLGNLRVRWTPECVISYTPDNFGAITRISARSVYNAWPATMSADGYVYDTVFAAGREERNPNGAEWTYHHDARGRLDAVNPDATSADAAYTYDADGNRVSKTAGGVTTLYLVDNQNPSGYAQVIEDRPAASGDPTVTYVYGLALVSQKRGAAVKYYGTDGLGGRGSYAGQLSEVTAAQIEQRVLVVAVEDGATTVAQMQVIDDLVNKAKLLWLNIKVLIVPVN